MEYLASITLFISMAVTRSAGEEYCWEMFNASCPGEEVIFMQSAKYGRMRLGECLMRDYYVGCSADVLTYLDAICSGRHSCQLDIPDNKLQKMQPCPKDLIAYLEATYKCIKVASGKNHYCMQGETITIPLTGEVRSGFLASTVTDTYGLGSANCPWRLTAHPGQRLNITLYDFNTTSKSDSPDVCKVYAIIRDKDSSAEVTVCGGALRERNVFASEYNVIDVQVMSFVDAGEPVHFLLKYDVVGCPDIGAPSRGHVKRLGNKAKITCNETGEVRHLVCNGTVWVGDVNECNTERIPAVAEYFGNTTAFPLGLLIAIIIGVLLGIVLGIVMLTVVMNCIKRKNRSKNSRSKIFLTNASQPVTGNVRNMTSDPRNPEIIRTSEYGYAHVWELQHLKPTTTDVNIVLSKDIELLKGKDVIPCDGSCLTSHKECCKDCKDSTMFERATLAHGDHSYPVEETPFYHEFEQGTDTR